MSRNPGEALDAGSRHLREALTYSKVNISEGPTAETLRTTVTMSADLHAALRMVAATAHCRLNDVMIIALEDLLAQQGTLPGDISRPTLRRRLQQTGRRKPTSAEHSDPSPAD
jgi:hypothetical protein